MVYLFNRIRDGRIKSVAECEMGEEQQGFSRGRGVHSGTIGGKETGGIG